MFTMRYRTLDDLDKRLFNDEGLSTISSEKQKEVESEIHAIYASSLSSLSPSPIQLNRKQHFNAIQSMIKGLSSSYVVYGASKTWMPYFLLTSLATLYSSTNNTFPSFSIKQKAVTSLLRYQSPLGGFGGEHGHLPHLASTYSAILALAMVKDPKAWDQIDRVQMYRWLLQLKQDDGSFLIHDNGENDLRGVYCALTVATLLNMLTPQLTKNCAAYISRCQSFDGGLSAVPNGEAHGGYTFCGLAAAMLLGNPQILDLPRLLHWAQSRQMPLEGGFQGRPNKLVDGCYSFWVGNLFNLLQTQLKGAEDVVDRTAAQEYLLYCCQYKEGGLIDKPGMYPDPYHICYGLTGLSSLQHYFDYDPKTLRFRSLSRVHVVGESSNLLNPLHPVFNIPIEDAERMQAYFSQHRNGFSKSTNVSK